MAFPLSRLGDWARVLYGAGVPGKVTMWCALHPDLARELHAAVVRDGLDREPGAESGCETAAMVKAIALAVDPAVLDARLEEAGDLTRCNLAELPGAQLHT